MQDHADRLAEALKPANVPLSMPVLDGKSYCFPPL
jgi:hypothetical protein